MASTREIRRRIRSVRNISQVTRAMEAVAASKMRRAQQQVLATRPLCGESAARFSVILPASTAAAGPRTRSSTPVPKSNAWASF